MGGSRQWQATSGGISPRLRHGAEDTARQEKGPEQECLCSQGTWRLLPWWEGDQKASFSHLQKQKDSSMGNSQWKKKSLRNKSPKNVKARNQISDNSDGIRRDQIPNKWKSIITYTMWGTRDCHSESPAPAVVYAHCQISTNHYGDRVTPNCSLGLWVWEWVLGLATWNKRVKYEKGHFKTPFQKVARLQRCLCG